MHDFQEVGEKWLRVITRNQWLIKIMKSCLIAKLPTHTQHEFVSKDVLSKIHGRTADTLCIKKCLHINGNIKIGWAISLATLISLKCYAIICLIHDILHWQNML